MDEDMRDEDAEAIDEYRLEQIRVLEADLKRAVTDRAKLRELVGLCVAIMQDYHVGTIDIDRVERALAEVEGGK